MGKNEAKLEVDLRIYMTKYMILELPASEQLGKDVVELHEDKMI